MQTDLNVTALQDKQNPTGAVLEAGANAAQTRDVVAEPAAADAASAMCHDVESAESSGSAEGVDTYPAASGGMFHGVESVEGSRSESPVEGIDTAGSDPQSSEESGVCPRFFQYSAARARNLQSAVAAGRRDSDTSSEHSSESSTSSEESQAQSTLWQRFVGIGTWIKQAGSWCLNLLGNAWQGFTSRVGFGVDATISYGIYILKGPSHWNEVSRIANDYKGGYLGVRPTPDQRDQYAEAKRQYKSYCEYSAKFSAYNKQLRALSGQSHLSQKFAWDVQKAMAKNEFDWDSAVDYTLENMTNDQIMALFFEQTRYTDRAFRGFELCTLLPTDLECAVDQHQVDSWKSGALAFAKDLSHTEEDKIIASFVMQLHGPKESSWWGLFNGKSAWLPDSQKVTETKEPDASAAGSASATTYTKEQAHTKNIETAKNNFLTFSNALSNALSKKLPLKIGLKTTTDLI